MYEEEKSNECDSYVYYDIKVLVAAIVYSLIEILTIFDDVYSMEPNGGTSFS